MARVVVYHSYFGCETGCCGHTVELTDNLGNEKTEFYFTHPYFYYRKTKEDELKFAQELVMQSFGAEHVADLDWEESFVSED